MSGGGWIHSVSKDVSGRAGVSETERRSSISRFRKKSQKWAIDDSLG